MNNDVSVLLNLTGKVVFERTDPLMDLVSGHGPFLYYDQLSLERFPLVREEQEDHALKLLINLRNLLESRRLSADDRGGKIRIIVTFDLVGGFAHRKDMALCFPAQKARRFREMVDSVFGTAPLLLKRFCYTFIFIECVGEDEADFYRQLAFDGHSGYSDDWMSHQMMTANQQRDQLLATLNSPLADTPLTKPKIKGVYDRFMQALDRLTDTLAVFMARAGQDEPFRRAVGEGCVGLTTVGDFAACDFDKLLRTAVSETVGLCSSAFTGCSSFVFKLRTGTVTHRKKDEVVLASLLQLLATMPKPWAETFSVVDAKTNEESVDVAALAKLRQAVGSCLPRMRKDGVLRWSEDKPFAFREYSARNNKPTETDTFSEVNDEVAEKRNQLYNEFCRLRRVPFYFGRKPGDWGWYASVTELLETIYAFEADNDRPLHDSLHRITDNEMNSQPRQASYAQLKVLCDKLREQKIPPNPMESLKAYLAEREGVMNNLAEQKEKLKTEMLRLGFAVTTFWISLLACLAITVGYAFHFFSGAVSDSPLWTGAALAVAALASVLAAVIGQSAVKKPIEAAFARIDDCLARLKSGQADYVEKMNKRISQQNAADIRRKNLHEMEEKLAQFDRHNMQVDLWEKHFAGLEARLADMMASAGRTAQPEPGARIAIDDSDLDVDEIPHLPRVVCHEFQSMQTSLSSGKRIGDITCFLTRLDVTSLNL